MKETKDRLATAAAAALQLPCIVGLDDWCFFHFVFGGIDYAMWICVLENIVYIEYSIV